MAYTLRVSVLDACQLRCRYCLPNAQSVIPKSSWLSLRDYDALARGLAPFGITKLRFTGGEPLLRRDLPAIIAVFARIFPTCEHALTTNGLRFLSMKDQLMKAGVSTVTFHLDTLQKERYTNIMGKGDIAEVFNAVKEAVASGLKVKINAVMQKGVNDDEIPDLLLFAKKHHVEMRFIELMNTGSAPGYVQKTFMSGQEILDAVACLSLVKPLKRAEASAPAEQFIAEDLGIKFGLIASDTRPFCAACNRLRLSVDGHMRTCLYEPLGQKLLCHDERGLNQQLRRILDNKTSFHPLLKKERSLFSMSQVGG